MKKELEAIRLKLDDIDRTIVTALAKRQELVKEVSSFKLDTSTGIRDLEREERLLSKIRVLASEVGLDRYYAEHLFREVITNSVRYQTHSLVDHQNQKGKGSIRVSFQGTHGAYSHLAAIRHFEERYAQVECYGYDTFQQAAQSVKDHHVDFAVLPIENTTAGSINDTYDILGNSGLYIVGEEILKITHCLLAVEPVDVSNIRRILSHPKAIEQCTRFLARLPRCKVESYIDTAVSAKKVLEDNDLSQAAIAGAHAADLYGLHVIEHNIANQEENFTRFVIVANESVAIDKQVPCKTSMVMETDHKEGALIECLNVLHSHGINMSKLESRPRPHEPWKYLFYLDVEGNMLDPEMAMMLEELQQKVSNLKLFGSYPRQE